MGYGILDGNIYSNRGGAGVMNSNAEGETTPQVMHGWKDHYDGPFAYNQGQESMRRGTLGQMIGAYGQLGYVPNFNQYTGQLTGGFQRLETSKDRAMNLLSQYLGKFSSDKGSGQPELTPYKIQTGPAIPQENVQAMQNKMMGDSLAQSAGVSQRYADSFAARGMGGSPLVQYLQANTEAQARGEGSRAGTQLGYDAALQNANYNLESQKADASNWNNYQQNLVGRYQAQNQLRNAILSAIGGIG